MKIKVLALLTVGLIAAPIAAIAQITTLSYGGDLMTGSSTYLPTGLAVPTNGSVATLPTAPVSGEFTAAISLSGSLAANDLTLVSYNVSFNGSNGIAGFAPTISFGPAPLSGFGGLNFCSATGSCIDLTTSNGAITGAAMDLVNTVYHASSSTIDIGPTGDAFIYRYATVNGTCESQINTTPGGGGIYRGGPVNPCVVRAGNKTAGEWRVTTTSAPEIDPASAGSGLTLLFGAAAVLRGRRKLES